MKPRWVPGLRGVAEWVGGDTPLTLDRPAREDFPGSSPTVYGPVPARDAAVLQRLGEVPVLLSTPTWEDMRIDPADLLDRLARYSAGGFAASEADLFLALLRTDLTRVTGEHLAAFAELLVPVLTQAGTAMPTPAGPAIARYVADPLVPPARVLDRTRHWWAPTPLKLPESLTEFPPRLKLDTPYSGLELGALAAGGVAGGAEGGSDAGAELALEIAHSDDAGLGLQLRQLARSATPLSPGLAMNLIGAQRGFHERAVHDGALAITEAWERGILLPGVADTRLLDWRETPGKLAALAAACVALAEDGMLAVVWPLLDDLVRVSLASTRRLAGTAELVEAIGELLPAVTDAVGRGVAPGSARALPGTRALAAAGGSSRAVQLARAVVGALPDEAAARAAEGATAGGATSGEAAAEAAPGAAAPGAPPQAEAATAALPGAALPDAALLDMVLPDAEFAHFWPDGRGTAPAVDDGATVRASWHDPKASTRLLEIELEFAPERLADPAAGPRRFRTRTSWFYDLEREGQCGMSEIHTADDAADPVADAWLRWDVEAGGVRVAEHRNWRDAKNGPLRHDGQVPPLTVGMLAVLIGSLNHDNAHGYTLLAAVRNDLFGAAGVRLAVARLLESTDYSPVKLAGIIEAEPDAIATLWPALVESIRVATSASAPPRWLNRVLDAALLRAQVLRAAAERGLIPADAAAWPGLADLAGRKGSQAALRKARELRVALGVRE
ncbi:DUF7824 domain-containing protein [Leucobacter komagatae]|uniref:DUF7824 domain-containing protein n=1 Tax=Leucobacter komagatae TaxID=55969 RepID=A0A0D0ILH2_9MICO|nr:DUF6493 family protein [Leucobacter komagatae]KIP52434.1 hypothetical protein SD72_09445 [Leucobacter komagatae]